MGTEREWKLKNGQLKLVEVEHYGYTVDFLSSLQVNMCVIDYNVDPHKN